MILTREQHQGLLKGLQRIKRLGQELADWGDLAYRQEAQEVVRIAKAQLKNLQEK